MSCDSCPPSTTPCRHEGSDRIVEIKLTEFDGLQRQVQLYRKILWVLARKEGLSLHIPQAELESVPQEAELMVWYEKLFDSTILKGICSPIDQPEISTPVIEKKNVVKRVCPYNHSNHKGIGFLPIQNCPNCA